LHKIPIHCARCLETFETEAARDNHYRGSCEVVPPKVWEGINEHQKKQLERRVSSKNTKEKNWYIIYEILFPGAEPPKSPYLDPPFADGILALREFAAREGPSMVREAILSDESEMVFHLDFDIQAFTESIFQRAFDLLLDQFESRRPWDVLLRTPQRSPNPLVPLSSDYIGSSAAGHIDVTQSVAEPPPPFGFEPEDDFQDYFLNTEWNTRVQLIM